VWLDFMAKWDDTDQIALTKDVDDETFQTGNGSISVQSCPEASGSAMAWTAKTLYTDYFVDYTSGTDYLVYPTDESANAWLVNYDYNY
jgi:hypothetical protein